ncbi:MAG: hypothetical protein ACK400_04865, partial [Pseudanabaena sp.]
FFFKANRFFFFFSVFSRPPPRPPNSLKPLRIAYGFDFSSSSLKRFKKYLHFVVANIAKSNEM